MRARFPRLFSPLELRGAVLRNRTVVCPMGSRHSVQGRPTEGDQAFYRARSLGGAGLIITGGTSVHPTALLRNRKAIEAFDPEVIPALKALTTAIHEGGAKVFAQLNHRGREMLGSDPQRNRDVDFPTWAPSPLPSPNDPMVPHVMTEPEIAEIVDAFALSAKNVVAAGYDGVEIHGAHGYLVAQFLSPQSNQRTDSYGGSAPNRRRFLIEVLEAVRHSIGVEIPLGVRLSAEEDIDGGLRLDDTVELARHLQQCRLIDYVSITRGIRNYYIKDMSYPIGVSVSLARAVREASGLVVLVAGRITHPTYAEEILGAGATDLIGMARAWIAEPEWAVKAERGDLDEIRPCIGILQDCRSGVMGCVHNPTTGREAIWPLHPPKTSTARRILVVGGGPAGMEAAMVAAQRGHRVVLFEKEAQLGGQAWVAARAPNRAEVYGVISYREMMLNRLGVDLRLGLTVGVEHILAESPEVVVLATGALPCEPELSGWPEHVHTTWGLLAGGLNPKRAGYRKAVVIDDGGGFWDTYSAVEYLAEAGLAVTVVTPSACIAGGVPDESKEPLLRRLRIHGVRFIPLAAAAWVEPGELVAYDRIRLQASGDFCEIRIETDVVVVNSGRRVNDSLTERLQDTGIKVHQVGDCLAPRRLSNAVFEAHSLARSL